jgi:hypothetical protein
MSFGAVGTDGWLVKFNSFGNVQWNTTYGGPNSDLGTSLVQTFDGGYALGGRTMSFGAVGYDGWLVKFDSAGAFQWSTIYGGADHDYGNSVVQTFDGGYALGGYTNSFGAAGDDGWLVKFDSFGNVQWNTTYGGAGSDRGLSVIQTSDGGYALGGHTDSFGAVWADGWLVKFDSAGAFQWDKTYGGIVNDVGSSVVQTSDGGYALGGYTDSFGATGYDGWLVKTDVENGLTWTSTSYAMILYRGKTDPYWNYLRVRIWVIEEPTWIFGDINMDGIVDAKDLAIVGKNYGMTFSLLSLGGLLGVLGVQTYKARKRPE